MDYLETTFFGNRVQDWVLASGDSLPDAARCGVAAGAAAVMTPGTELCRKDDVENLLDRM